MLTDVKDGKDVGMVQGGNRPGFLLEATQALRFAGKRFGKNL